MKLAIINNYFKVHQTQVNITVTQPDSMTVTNNNKNYDFSHCYAAVIFLTSM
jgi:hypothetical protein